MSQLLLWATEDKPVTNVLDLFTVRPRAKKKPKYDEEQPSDIVNNADITSEIYTILCTVCEKQSDGNPCGLDEKCPW
jgi:hypothetical protein